MAPDHEVIAKASGGRALKGMTFTGHANEGGKQPLLQLLPDADVALCNPVESSKSVDYCFSTSQQSVSFWNDVKDVGWTFAGKLHAASLLCISASGKSHEVQHEGTTDQSKVSEACILHCIYVPTKCFQIRKQNMILSDAALKQALDINNVNDADNVLEMFNPFVFTGVYHLGGIFLRKVTVKSNEKARLVELMSDAQKKLSGNAKVGVPIVVMALGASGEVSRSTNNEWQVSNARSSGLQLSAEEVQCFGPTTARTAEEFRQMMSTGDTACWSIIDKGEDNEGSLVAVWDLLLQHSRDANSIRAAEILCGRCRNPVWSLDPPPERPL